MRVIGLQYIKCRREEKNRGKGGLHQRSDGVFSYHTMMWDHFHFVIVELKNFHFVIVEGTFSE